VTDYRVRFHRPHQVGTELAGVARTLDSDHWDGAGAATKACEELLEQDFGCARALLTTSCTHALELAALLLDIKSDDEVIIPSFTFVSTANAFALRGAKLVFCDIRPDTLCLDEEQLGLLITERTRAIVPVHYGGIACNMNAICALAEGQGLAVVEDNAHGLGGTYRGRRLGTFGALATLSFHGTKNISCGEGGAIIVNDEALVDRAEMMHQKGTDRAQFLAGKVEEYTWQVLGSSYVMSEILAAMLLAQLEAASTITAARTTRWNRYHDELAEWAANEGVALPEVPPDCEHPAHLFAAVMPSAADRSTVIHHLAESGIQATSHYTPLHSSVMGHRVGSAPLGAPVTEHVSACLVRLPLYPDLNEQDQSFVIDELMKFRCQPNSDQPDHFVRT
jgi:dTDP-4-amino-4,6-dideoxygalactose transaminase